MNPSSLRIKISSENIGEVYATLTDENPITTQKFYDALPIKGEANLWGDEIYFSIPVDVGEENGRVVVNVGEIAIWVENPAFCVFFGKTPVSTQDEIKAFSNVNVIGKIECDLKMFKEVKNREKILLEKGDYDETQS